MSRFEDNPVATRYMADSIARMGAEDRSWLGSFALPLDALVIVQADLMLQVDGRVHGRSELGREARTLLIARYVRMVNRKGIGDAVGQCTVPFYAEVLVIWSRHVQSDAELALVRRVRKKMLGLDEAMSRLETVLGFPEGLPYFEADIWERALIDACLVDGIDPSLAVELSGV